MLDVGQFIDDDKNGFDDTVFDLQIMTHKLLNPMYKGKVLDLKEGYSKVEFKPAKFMVVDRDGLLAGGFLYGVAEYSAMIAINQPHLFLTSSKISFYAPLEFPDTVVFEAIVKHKESRKKSVYVSGMSSDIKVFDGDFSIVVLEESALNLKLKAKDDR